MVTGLFGLFISRTYPRRLTTSGEAVLYERIPRLRLLLKKEVEDLVLEAARADQTTTIADFYADRLADFMHEPRNLTGHLLYSTRPFAKLQDELDAIDRYLNPAEREIMIQIREFVELKEGLDFQWALQSALKGWLFVHIPLTYSLMAVAVLHMLLVLGFQGGLR